MPRVAIFLLLEVERLKRQAEMVSAGNIEGTTGSRRRSGGSSGMAAGLCYDLFLHRGKKAKFTAILRPHKRWNYTMRYYLAM